MASYLIVQKLRELTLFLQLCCVFVLGNTLLFMSSLSYAKKITVQLMHTAAGEPLPEEMFWNALFTRAMMKTLWNDGLSDIRKSVTCGEKAPDPVLVDPSTGEETRLLKVVDGQKLQVLAFGSYTCPVFRSRFKQLQSMAEEFHRVADFTLIYIDEAHPADGWVFKYEVEISKHQNMEDRLKAAQKFSADFCKQSCVRVFADSMQNEATTMYGVRPIRLYVLYNETVIYEGGTGPTYFNLDEVRQTINNSSASCVVV